MELIPNEGIGDIRFGMTPPEVRAIMGDKLTYEDWMGGNINDSLHYPGIVLPFDKHRGDGPLDDGRLIEAWINEGFDVTFKEIDLFYKSTAFIEELLQQLGTRYKLRTNDEASLINIEEYNWELFFEHAQLVHIRIYRRR